MPECNLRDIVDIQIEYRASICCECCQSELEGEGYCEQKAVEELETLFKRAGWVQHSDGIVECRRCADEGKV